MTNGSDNLNLVKKALNIFYHKGDFSISRFLLVVFFGIIALVLWQKNSVMDYWAETLSNRSVQDCTKSVEDWRMRNFKRESITQPRSIMNTLKPDYVGLYLYNPKDKHHFLELVSYEGRVPERFKGRDLNQLGVDKTDLEYQNHSLGLPFYTTWPSIYLGVNVEKDGPWYYSCPIYSFDNVYIGYMKIEWENRPAIVDVDWKKFNRQLFSACQPSARQVGVYLYSSDDFPKSSVKVEESL